MTRFDDKTLTRIARLTQAGDLESCWPWVGYVANTGYGQMRIGGRKGPQLLVHRVIYELACGTIPDGLTIDHTCHNASEQCGGGVNCAHRRCVNPRHLEAVTRRENILRGKAPAARHARQTHCLNGHPFNVVNTRISTKGARQCRACARDYQRRLREVARAA